MGTQLNRRRNREEVEQTWAADAAREADKPPAGHGQIVREDPDGPAKVATVKPPQKHVDGDGKEVVPYRQINQADPAPPVQHGAGTTLEAPVAPTHKVGAPAPQQGSHHPVGHVEPSSAQGEAHTPVYRISASTTSPAGAVPVAPQQGFKSMQQPMQGVHKVGGQPVQPTAVGLPSAVQTVPAATIGMPASVHAVPGLVNPEQAAQILAQRGGQPQAQGQFQGGGAGQQQPHVQGQFQGGAGGIGPSAGVGAQPQPGQPLPQQRPLGSAEVLQENSVATIALADEETTLAEMEAAGLGHRARQQTTIQRRVQAEELAPAERMDVTVVLTCYRRPQLLRTQLDALRRGTKVPAAVCVLVMGDGPHPAEVLSDGSPWVDGPLPQNTYKLGATPWTRFQVALDAPTKYVCVLDDDCVPGLGWLEECVRASDAGLNAVVAAAGSRLGPDGSVVGFRGPWRAEDGANAVSDFQEDHDRAAVVDVGALGWFLPTAWMPPVAQLGPAGHVPTGWATHLSAMLRLEGELPTVVLPYALEDQSTWGATVPAAADGLRTQEGMGSLRDDVFRLYREEEDGQPSGWNLVDELDPSDRSRDVPATAPVQRVDAAALASAAAPEPGESELAPGAYFNAKLQRVVEPGEPEWSAEHYELVMGEPWGGSERVAPAEVTDSPELATTDGPAPGTLARSERPQVGDADAPEPEPEVPKAEPADVSPAIIEVDAGKHAWCACGQSKKQPFCDGSHKGTPFEPVLFELKVKKKIVLCMCKGTKKPPFCDGSHAKIAAERDAAAVSSTEG